MPEPEPTPPEDKQPPLPSGAYLVYECEMDGETYELFLRRGQEGFIEKLKGLDQKCKELQDTVAALEQAIEVG